jgi:hypothetical protein
MAVTVTDISIRDISEAHGATPPRGHTENHHRIRNHPSMASESCILWTVAEIISETSADFPLNLKIEYTMPHSILNLPAATRILPLTTGQFKLLYHDGVRHRTNMLCLDDKYLLVLE